MTGKLANSMARWVNMMAKWGIGWRLGGIEFPTILVYLLIFNITALPNNTHMIFHFHKPFYIYMQNVILHV